MNGPHLNSKWPGRWVFRGHEDVSYRLVPTAMRPNALLFDNKDTEDKGKQGWIRATRQTHREQNAAEAFTLLKFMLLADGQGLPLPEDSQHLRNKLLSLQVPHQREKLIAEWPADEFLSLLGLAQHYGVATRLLDWSRSPLVSAYFAAVGAARRVLQEPAEASRRLSVWALADSAMRAPSLLQHEVGEVSQASRVLQVSAPAASNDNLHAQQGLFSLNRPVKTDLDEPVDRRPLDELLGETLKMFRVTVLWEFTLEKQHAPELLRRLAIEGASAARFFPGLGGVAMALAEEQLWDEQSCPPHS